MVKDIGKLNFRAVRKHGNGNAAKCGGGEESHYPVGHVLRENGYPVTMLYAKAGHPQGELLRLAAELFI